MFLQRFGVTGAVVGGGIFSWLTFVGLMSFIAGAILIFAHATLEGVRGLEDMANEGVKNG